MRKLKSINIFFDPTQTSVTEIENIPNFKDLVYGELYEAIKNAKEDTVPLFEINNSGNIIELNRENWTSALEAAICYFETKEEYEKCANYKNLVNQIYEQRNRSNSTSNKQSVKRSNADKKKKDKKSYTRKSNIHRNDRSVEGISG